VMSRSFLAPIGLVLTLARPAVAAPRAPVSPPPSSAIGPYAEAFVRNKKLSAQQAAQFRRLVLRAHSTTDGIALKHHKVVTDEEREAIWQDARKQAVGFLDDQQLKSFDQVGWGILFYRPAPNEVTPGKALGKMLQDAHDGPSPPQETKGKAK
jgi:hypothetical protein